MEAGTIQLTEALKSLFKETAEHLTGTAQRQFMAKVVQGLGISGQTLAEQEWGWNRGTIRKGMQALTHGAIEDQFHLRGRKRVEKLFTNSDHDHLLRSKIVLMD